MGKIKCLMHTIYDLLKYRIFAPHVFVEESKERVTIIANSDSFRVSKTYEHGADEVVYPDAILYHNKCIYCGKEDLSWSRNENIPQI